MFWESGLTAFFVSVLICQMTHNKNIMSVTQAAREMGVERQTVLYHLAKGQLEGEQIPGSRVWFVYRRSIARWEREFKREKKR